MYGQILGDRTQQVLLYDIAYDAVEMESEVQQDNVPVMYYYFLNIN